jgi:hypothetical protein
MSDNGEDFACESILFGFIVSTRTITWRLLYTFGYVLMVISDRVHGYTSVSSHN